MKERVIWDFLLEKTGNEYGTAAIMGNLMAESSLNPLCATGKNKVPDYAQRVDDGLIDFAHDGVAFGIAQWCYSARKQALLDYAEGNGISIGDLDMQLRFLVKEMSEKYKGVWRAVCEAVSVREASDVVMLKYEKPGNVSEAAKNKRAEYGVRFLDKFDGVHPDDKGPGKGKWVVAVKNVNIRAGDGLDQLKVGVLNAGSSLEWIETRNGWHKVACWVSGDFSEVKT